MLGIVLLSLFRRLLALAAALCRRDSVDTTKSKALDRMIHVCPQRAFQSVDHVLGRPWYAEAYGLNRCLEVGV